MNNRPVIRIKPGRNDILPELIGWVFLLVTWVISIYGLIILPDQIALHFDLSGNVTRYGDKDTILFLPLITTVLLVGLTILNRYPHIFNYPYPITPMNAERQYRAATRLLRWLKVLIAALFLFISVAIFRTSFSDESHMPSWFFMFILILFFFPVIVYFYSAKQQR